LTEQLSGSGDASKHLSSEIQNLNSQISGQYDLKDLILFMWPLIQISNEIYSDFRPKKNCTWLDILQKRMFLHVLAVLNV